MYFPHVGSVVLLLFICQRHNKLSFLNAGTVALANPVS